MDIQFGNLQQLHWFWLVLIVAGGLMAAILIRRRAIRQFATPNLMPRLFPAGMSRRQFASALVSVTAMSLLVIALVDVRWGKSWREVPQKGIEVIFALDVSRSMLAADVAPNRLERAKQQIRDMVDEMAGDRVGLVIFAGDCRQQIPLTRHYHDFKIMLDEVGPWDVDRGGSRLAEVLELAANSFLEKTGDHKAIVVFSDGEDQNSDPVSVAGRIYGEQGIRVFTVGIGDPAEGARVPAPGNARGQQYMQYNGQTVWSKLDSGTLQQVALQAAGAYIPAETRHVDMAAIYQQYVADVEQQDFETARINSYIPRFQIFVGLALMLVLLQIFWPSQRRGAAGRSGSKRRRWPENSAPVNSSNLQERTAA